jgi:SAM-dependent methyltransferase
VSGGFTCASCGATSARHWRTEGGWQIVRCRGCGLGATWPRPDAATLSKLYESHDYYDERWMGTDTDQAWQARARQVLAALPAIRGPILDFGAGSGGLVHGLRSIGIDAEGVEPSAAGRALARDLYGIDLMPSLDDVSHSRYGAVILLHVLEHIPDPRADLEALGARLTPNGVAFIEVPHAGSVEMWLPSRRRAILDPPAHLHHFTPKTVRTLLGNAGYEVLDMRLFNAAPVERVLAWRAAHRASRTTRPSPESVAVTEPRAAPARSRAASMKALAALRRMVQGHKFQVMARPARRSV